MKIIIFGYGNLGKVLADHAITNKFNTLIVSRKKTKSSALPFVNIEKFNSLAENLSNYCLISTIPPNEKQEDFVISNVNPMVISKAKKIIYISSTSVYQDGEVDENTKAIPKIKRGKIRLKIENHWKKIAKSSIIIRPGGIYNNKNNLVTNFLNGDHKVIFKKNHFTNRIHIEDLVGIIFQTIESNISTGIINAIDECFVDTYKLLEQISKKFNLPKPIKIDYTSISSPKKSFYEVSKKVKSIILKEKLNYSLKYPDFKIFATDITKKYIKSLKNNE